MKILLIDDEPFALKLLQAQLNNLGFTELVSHGSAIEALSILELDTGGFDLVMCDLQMPDMDGIEFIRHLAVTEYIGGLILISGEDTRILATAEKLANSHNLNVLGVLNKPVLPESLTALLERKLPNNIIKKLHKGVIKKYDVDELQRAIKKGELVNYYQPQVDVSTGKVVGVETLVRWQHPTDGLVYPEQFISVAEEHNLIDDLTKVVLFGAILQSRIWQHHGKQLHVAVNISMDNLSSLQFPDLVAQAANTSGVAPNSLILEVTESRLMSNPLSALEILTRLRLKHIGLSIDDFGTGHSSLAQLRDIPFDELKIDQSFVHGAWRDTSLQAIFEASLGMARHLGIKVVAEGVEDIDDWNYLQKMGCDLAQGYFIAKPMPADELEEWMIGWDRRCDTLLDRHAQGRA